MNIVSGFQIFFLRRRGRIAFHTKPLLTVTEELFQVRAITEVLLFVQYAERIAALFPFARDSHNQGRRFGPNQGGRTVWLVRDS